MASAGLFINLRIILARLKVPIPQLTNPWLTSSFKTRLSFDSLRKESIQKSIAFWISDFGTREESLRCFAQIKSALVSALLEVLKKIRDGEREASKMLEEANTQAEKIKQEAEEKAEKVYQEAYEEFVSAASRKSMKLKEKAREDAERESKKFLLHAEKQIKALRAKAEKNFDAAVNAILKEFVS